MATTYTLISSNTLSASAASVTFSSIPSTYTDLCLKISARSDFANAYDGLAIVFNSDTATNYSRVRLYGNGSSAASSLTANLANLGSLTTTGGNGGSANIFGNTEVYIPNYTSTSSRPLSVFGVSEDSSATVYIATNAHLYRGTSAISTIAISPTNGTNWLSGSSFYLYGIKNS